MEKLKRKKKINKTGISLAIFHVLYFILSVIAIISVIHIQYFWKPDDKTTVYFKATP